MNEIYELVGVELITALKGSKVIGGDKHMQFDFRRNNPQLANRVVVKLNDDGSYRIEYYEFRTSTHKYQEVNRMCHAHDAIAADNVRKTIDELVVRDRTAFNALPSRTKVPHS